MDSNQLRFGVYEVVGPLGSGGMGEVYRARDPRLKRDVAIKVLAERLAADAESTARFQRESQILASLNHPSIASIYDVVEDGSRRYIVMELIEGPTLAERLLQGSLAMSEAVRIAIQIADAIEAAHERGIVHRDLKPANVKLTETGVKILDFGLAKGRAQETLSAQDSADTPTALTSANVILGTTAYMAPEQIAGGAITTSVDVWAFGCVLYEMLCHSSAFDAPTTQETFAAILRREPDWTRLPDDTPATVRRVLRHCLEKDRRQRLHHMGDIRLELEDVHDPLPVAAAASSKRTTWMWAAVATGVVALLINLVWAATRPAPSPPAEVRLDIVTPPTSQVSSFALSPDGTRILFVANDQGHSKLWLRALNSPVATPLEGTDFALYPFWKPDNKSVGFFSEGQLKRLDLDGGPPRSLASAPVPRGATWTANGTIVFAPLAAGPLYRIPEKGGQAEPLTASVGKDASHRFPLTLADGQIVFRSNASDVASYVIDAGGAQRRLTDTPVVGGVPGQILLVGEGKVLAAPFVKGQLDAKRETLISGGVEFDEYARPAVSTSPAGVIAYRRRGSFVRRELTWFDRNGSATGKLETTAEMISTSSPALSPDGTRIAVHFNNQGTDVWTIDLNHGTTSRIPTEPGSDIFPVWSPDGKQLVFSSNRNGVFDLFETLATGTRKEEELLPSRSDKFARDWSSDGQYVLYEALDAQNTPDIWALSMNGDHKTFPITQSRFSEECPQFSPDSRWIAFQSNQSGRFEIYLQRLSDDASRIQVSTEGGTQPRWNRNGNELFYVAPKGELISVTLKRNTKSDYEVVNTKRLFSIHVGDTVIGQDGIQYLVSGDGQRFLINTITAETVLPITVILNWHGK